MEYEHFHYESPIGTIQVTGNENAISSVVFIDEPIPQDLKTTSTGMISQCIKQLDEFFIRERQSFELELVLNGTDFQKSVWKELLNIPYGSTISYKALTQRRWDMKAIRAVAAANGVNPISIIVPCHRVVGSDGSLTGYAGGIWRKRWLLEFEQGQSRLSL